MAMFKGIGNIIITITMIMIIKAPLIKALCAQRACLHSLS